MARSLQDKDPHNLSVTHSKSSLAPMVHLQVHDQHTCSIVLHAVKDFCMALGIKITQLSDILRNCNPCLSVL